jgi:hypothetical protein
MSKSFVIFYKVSMSCPLLYVPMEASAGELELRRVFHGVELPLSVSWGLVEGPPSLQFFFLSPFGPSFFVRDGGVM